MADDKENPGSGAGEAKPPKTKAEDNPWYLLATLYGVPEFNKYELRAKNRVAWNRYFATSLGEGTRARFIKKRRHSEEELTPFSPEELQEVATAFAERCKASAKKLVLPATSDEIDFSNVKFDQKAVFEEYLFESVSFNGATFSHGAVFNSATFFGLATFDGAAFSNGPTFGGATFSFVASFRGATFRVVRFDDAKFHAVSSFSNAEMKSNTTFEGVKFITTPPEYFGSKLHQDTVWRGITWPPFPKNTRKAGRFIDAYACLKLEMERLKKHEDELNFFALELQSRRVLLGRWGLGLPIALYGLLSDYGRSYVRPLVALFVVSAIGAGVFWYFDARACEEALGLSAASTLNVFGFRRDFNLSLDTPLTWLKVFAAIQTIFGTILLFLLGLGIRNKFRMK